MLRLHIVKAIDTCRYSYTNDAALQVSGKKVRRVTWAAGVVSPRPRARRRKRRCEDVEAGGTCASFLLPCPPDDGALGNVATSV